jgi:hypothetical protein
MSIITAENWYFEEQTQPSQDTTTGMLTEIPPSEAVHWEVQSVSIRTVYNLHTTNKLASLIAPIRQSYAYYPFLTILLHAITWTSLVLLGLTVLKIKFVSTYLLFGILISIGGLTVILAMASQEIDSGRKKRNT